MPKNIRFLEYRRFLILEIPNLVQIITIPSLFGGLLSSDIFRLAVSLTSSWLASQYLVEASFRYVREHGNDYEAYAKGWLPYLGWTALVIGVIVQVFAIVLNRAAFR